MDPQLLVQPHSEDMPQAAVLLAAALQEGEIFDTPCAITNTEIQHSWFAFCLLTVYTKKKNSIFVCKSDLNHIVVISYSLLR